MSDRPQGERWWQAPDEKWYPPEERLKYEGKDTTIAVTENAVLLTYRDKPTRRIPLAAISDVELKEVPPWWNVDLRDAPGHGWLQLGLGGKALRTLTFAKARIDPNTVRFVKSNSAHFSDLHKWIQRIVTANREAGIDASTVEYDLPLSEDAARWEERQGRQEERQRRQEELQQPLGFRSEGRPVRMTRVRRLDTKSGVGSLVVSDEGITHMAGLFGTTTIAFKDMDSIEVVGEVANQSRVGAVATVGVFGLAKRRTKYSTTVRLHMKDGSEPAYEVDKVSPSEVRARIAPKAQAAGVPWYEDRRLQSQMQQTQTPSVSLADELTKLAGLRNQGILSEAEFETQKSRLLRQET